MLHLQSPHSEQIILLRIALYRFCSFPSISWRDASRSSDILACPRRSRLDRWRRRLIRPRRKHSDKFDRNQCEKHQQIDAQRPKGYSNRRRHLDARHTSASRTRNEPFHNIAIMNNSQKALVFIDYRDHVKLITAEQLRQVLSRVVLQSRNDRRYHHIP